jgi:hypothetical protein
LYKCEECGKEFASQAALAQHLKDKHGVEKTGAAEGLAAPQEERKGAKPKTRRRRNRHPVAIGLSAIAIALGIGLYVLVAPNFAPTPVPCSSGESFIHVHPYLRIAIEGTNVPIPTLLGDLTNRGCLEVIHTHDASGIIHIELSSTDSNANYTLGDLFRVWHATYPGVIINGTSHPVEFSNTDIFGFKTDSTHKLVVLVDKNPVANGVGVPLEQLDYCSAANSNVPPCSPTARGDPLWKGGTAYPYGTGHTIVIEYVST